MFLDQSAVDARFVVKPVDKRSRSHVAEIFISCFVFGKKEHMVGVGFHLFSSVMSRNVGFHAYYRLYFGVFQLVEISFFIFANHRRVEIDDTVHISVIRYRCRRHSELFQLLRQFPGLYKTVKKRIYCMKMQVDKSHFSPTSH